MKYLIVKLCGGAAHSIAAASASRDSHLSCRCGYTCQGSSSSQPAHLKIVLVDAKSWISCLTTLMPRSSDAFNSNVMFCEPHKKGACMGTVRCVGLDSLLVSTARRIDKS